MPRSTLAAPVPNTRARRAARLVCLAALIALGARPVAAQSSDVTPPSLISFSFTPLAVDVRTEAQTISVTAHLTDDLSGVSALGMYFVSPSGRQSLSLSASAAGAPRDVTVHGSSTLQPFAESGTWTVVYVYVTDQVGNSLNVSTAQLQARGFPTTLDVTSNPDVQPPVVTGLTLSPPPVAPPVNTFPPGMPIGPPPPPATAVDVSAGDQSVTVTLKATDVGTGVALSSCPQYVSPYFVLTLDSPSGRQQRFVPSTAFSQTAGTPQDGTWTGSFTMPRYSEAGTWLLDNVQISDCAGNQTYIGRFQLQYTPAGNGLQQTLEVVSNTPDISAPVLTGLTFSPITINTSTGVQTVTVQMSITDDLSGVVFSPTTPDISNYEAGISFRSPSGNQTRENAYFPNFQLVSGTTLNGVWQGTVTFPQYSEQGSWRVSQLQVKDAVRNIQFYSTADLQGLGFNTILDVIKPSLITDASVGPTGGTVNDVTFGNRASITFPAGALTQPTQVAIDVFLDPLDVPTPVGFSGPGTNFVNIQLTPQPNYPLAPPGLTIVLPIPHSLTPGMTLMLYKIDVATGALVPAHSVYGGDVSGTVNSDGLSATFNGISSLSTVVGLIPHTLHASLVIKPGALTTTTLGSTITVNTSATDATGTNSPWKYVLDWGDGTSFSATLTSLPTASKPTARGHAYTARGTYTITLTITGKNGSSDVQTLVVTVN